MAFYSKDRSILFEYPVAYDEVKSPNEDFFAKRPYALPSNSSLDATTSAAEPCPVGDATAGTMAESTVSTARVAATADAGEQHL
mgnify:CR=1 FL=1